MSPNCYRDQNFSEKYEVKYDVCIEEVSEEFIKYVSRYSNKCLKFKELDDFESYSICVIFK